ncbi:MAG: helix-turn-helix domain-containing protein [Planctomycetes bacterium]|nr:helix-turn-helix domain-containing protein [Planctomycetota bacterium]
MTQAALARAAGLSQGALARIEAGDRSATIGTLVGIARALRLALPSLLAEVPAVANPPRAEKAWFRLCSRLRDRDEAYILALERVAQALDALESRRVRRK